ncbi:MAG: FkbM family methyltransferase [bacterium]|nr:FkbM family methyltransferase [bacterium]
MKKRIRSVVLLLLLFGSVYAYLEGPWTTPPGWWRAHEFWPFASGPVRWRIEALRLKVIGRLPELSWGELWGYYYIQSSDQDAGGFVTLGESSREGTCPTLWNTPLGELWGRRDDGYLLEFLFMEQLIDRIYEKAEVEIRPGDTVIDVGGHLGVFTLLALSRGAETVVVVEPEPTNIACLEKSFQDELREGSVVLVKAAAWHRRDLLEFHRPDPANTGGGKIIEGGSTQVEALRIDEIVDELALERIDFIKMDIEGAERHALAGAKQTLVRFKPRLALCIYHEFDDPEVISEIALDARSDYQVKITKNVAYFH